MNKKQLISLATAVLFSASGLAGAKGGPQANSGATGAATPAATQPATNTSNAKADSRFGKGNVNPTAPGDGARDPYSVPLFKDARPVSGSRG